LSDEKIQEIITKSAFEINKIKQNTEEIEKTVKEIVKRIISKNKIVLFGNGGSAADAQHIAAEFIGRFVLERNSYPAIALTTDSSTITALSNDYSFEDVFSRQCQGLVNKGDIVIGISTSGNSENVKKGLQMSKNKGAFTVGLLGNGGGNIRKIVDISIIVDSSSTPRIQECHRTIYHIICELVEFELSKNEQNE
jgi:D-sedoheptulose 7-phosphate isomerase